jgi:hypothetical protein
MSIVEFAWVDLKDRLPPYDATVVCTDDSTACWLDRRMVGFEAMTWQGHTATHWYPVPDMGVLSSLPNDIDGLRAKILATASAWKGADGAVHTLNAMALELAQALAPHLLAGPIFERAALIAEVFDVGREHETVTGREIAVRIRADAIDFLKRS